MKIRFLYTQLMDVLQNRFAGLFFDHVGYPESAPTDCLHNHFERDGFGQDYRIDRIKIRLIRKWFLTFVEIVNGIKLIKDGLINGELTISRMHIPRIKPSCRSCNPVKKNSPAGFYPFKTAKSLIFTEGNKEYKAVKDHL